MSVMSTPIQPPPSHSNPFASRYVRPGALSFRVGSGNPPIDNIVARLREVRCGVLVGDHGTGKSTLLRELASQLNDTMPGGQWVQLTQTWSASPSLSFADRCQYLLPRLRETIANIRTVAATQRRVVAGGVLVIDGAEQLPAAFRSLIARSSHRREHFVLLTSHHDISSFQTLYRTRLTPTLIHELLDELLSIADAESNITLRAELQKHIAGVNLDEVTNVRLLWDQLYEVAQRFSRTT